MESKGGATAFLAFKTFKVTRMRIYKNQGNYLLVESDEPYSLPMFFMTIHEVAERCRLEDLKKALIDISKMSGSPSTIDRYETGLEIAKYWGARLQVAAIASKEKINFLAETVAVNRGAHFKVFWSASEALEWLGVDNPHTH
jgi:hypothetical protein